MRPIPPLANPNAERVRDRPWFETTFSKLHVFGMQDYDKVIYLDADLLITQNIDLLFDVDVSSDPDIPFAVTLLFPVLHEREAQSSSRAPLACSL